MDRLTFATKVGLIAAALVILGTILPWITIVDQRAGYYLISRNGIETGGGDVVFAVRAAAVVGGLGLITGRHGFLYLAPLMGILIVSIGWANLGAVADRVAAPSDVLASVGIGLYLLIAAGVVLTGASASDIVAARRAATKETAPAVP